MIKARRNDQLNYRLRQLALNAAFSLTAYTSNSRGRSYAQDWISVKSEEVFA